MIIYCIASYLFEFGASTVPGGTNWYNILFAPVFMPFKIGRALALLLTK